MEYSLLVVKMGVNTFFDSILTASLIYYKGQNIDGHGHLRTTIPARNCEEKKTLKQKMKVTKKISKNSMTECRDACNNLDACHHFNFDTLRNKCFLLEIKYPKKNIFVSGEKYCKGNVFFFLIHIIILMSLQSMHSYDYF